MRRPSRVRGPAHEGEAKTVREKPLRGKLFRNGGSQAVRLPKECRLPGKEVGVTVEGDRVVLHPLDDHGYSREFIEMFLVGPPQPDAFPDRPPQGDQQRRELEDL